MDCIFCKIVKKEIQSSIVYEDEKVLAFRDIAPQAPVHILVVPKEHAASLMEIKDLAIMKDLFSAVRSIVLEQELDRTGFRIVINTGRAAGQAVDHIHIHILGGRDFSWPPG